MQTVTLRLLLSIPLLAASCVYASGLQPILSHVHGRTPAAAWAALQYSPHQNTVVSNIAAYNGWTRARTLSILNTGAYSICSLNQPFASDGLLYASGAYSVGSIVRSPYEGEKFACVNGKPFFSGTCGNPIQPSSVRSGMVCTSGPEERSTTITSSGSVTYGGLGAGGAPTQTRSSFRPIHCHTPK